MIAGLVVAACSGTTDANGSAPALDPPEQAAVTPSGFSATSARLTEPNGASCERCLLLAATTEEHRRGLMAVTSLGGYDGMAFRYDAPTSTSYWMKDTVLALSISFYDDAGTSIARFDMDPCVTAVCPTFGPDRPFTVAVEVEQGRLDELGFTPTSRLELLGTPCTPAIRTG